MTQRNPDRVGITFSKTIQIRDYEPVRVEIMYQSDVKEKETPEKAFERVTKVVEDKAKEELTKIIKIKRKG